MRYFLVTLLAFIVLSSLSVAWEFDPNTIFGSCMINYCSEGDKSCTSALCNPIFSGCGIPCAAIYSYNGAPCWDACGLLEQSSSSPCAKTYFSSAWSCFSGCWHAADAEACAENCKNNARAGYDSCSESTPATQAPATLPPATRSLTTTTRSTTGCNNNGICESSRRENCQNCRNDCPCYDLRCSPGTSGANSWGCIDPCLAVDHAHYDPSVGNCVCDSGYFQNSAGDCVSESNCPENTVRSGTKCVCVEGYADCNKRAYDGCEVSLESDDLNCGGCGVRCAANSQCQNMLCVCDDGYELDKTGKKCVEITSCNKNKECEPERYENCLNCPDCACEVTKSFCDGAPIYPSVTDERGCRDCKGYCQLKYSDQHMDGRKKGKDYMCECNCELGYDLAEDGHCKEAKKKAYIFISSDLSWRHVLFGGPKVDHIEEFYASKGYEVHMYPVKDAGAMLDVLKAKPEIGAIAYFGHEAGLDEKPTIGALDAASLKSKMNNDLTYEYNERGMTLEDARAKADDKLKDGFGFDYAYIHTCHSFDDNSLADTLVKKGGTFWGDKGILIPAQTLYEYKRQ